MNEDIVVKVNGEPFETLRAAKSAVVYHRTQSGVEYTPIEIEGGFGLVRNDVDGGYGLDSTKDESVKNEKEEVDVPERRPSRIPITQRDVLTAPQKDGYVRRFVNINDRKEGWQRVLRFMEAGYRIVPGDVEIGDPRVSRISKMGKANIVSVGGGMKAILMEQRQEWYDEDMRTRDIENKKITESMIKKDLEGFQGDITINLG